MPFFGHSEGVQESSITIGLQGGFHGSSRFKAFIAQRALDPSAIKVVFAYAKLKVHRGRIRMSDYSLRVDVMPQYLADQSEPEEEVYVFSYTITITNTGQVAAQLISRTWHINDAQGQHEKVRGLGVVGHQPLLQPGQSFQYTSGTHLRTPTGTMHGSYFCVGVDGERFEVDIPMFVLDALSGQYKH